MFVKTALNNYNANFPFTFRLNFTLEDLAVTSPAYNYFLGRIEELERMEKRLKARKLGTEFPKYLQYDRVNELVNAGLIILCLKFSMVCLFEYQAP